MKVVPGIVVAVCCTAANLLPCSAQPAQLAQSAQPAPNPALISFRFRDTKVSEAAQMIAEQGNLTVLIHDSGDVSLKFMALQDVTPEAALKQLGLAAGLVLTRGEDATYILSKAGVVAPTDTEVRLAHLEGEMQQLKATVAGLQEQLRQPPPQPPPATPK